MKTGPYDLDTDQIDTGSAKTYKRDLTPSVSSKTSQGAQNMKIGPDALRTALETQNMKTGLGALGTVENESKSAKHVNGTRRPRYRPKRFRERNTGKQDQALTVPSKMCPGAQKMKTGPDALDFAENDSRSAKHEN
jgi:hypothetical protein